MNTRQIMLLLLHVESILEDCLGVIGPQDPPRTGGHFRVYDLNTGDQIVWCSVGEVNGERGAKYARFSREKAVRLQNTHKELGHSSSWQSRDKGQEMWGGAVALKKAGLIFSFSGLPEKADEALCLVVGRTLGLIDKEDARAIAETSTNTYYAMLME